LALIKFIEQHVFTGQMQNYVYTHSSITAVQQEYSDRRA